MAEMMLTAAARKEMGTHQVRRLRKGGKVPAVFCEKGKPSTALLVDSAPLHKLVGTGAHLVDLDMGGRKEKALVRAVQWNAVTQTIIHVDFVKVSMTEAIEVDVDVVLKGKPVGVSEDGGRLMHYTKALKVSCLPTAIPEKIEVEVGALKIGDVIHVREAKVPAGVKVLTDAESALCGVVPPALEEAAPVAAAGEAAAPTSVEPEVIKKERKVEEGEEGAAPAAKKEPAKKDAGKKEKE